MSIVGIIACVVFFASGIFALFGGKSGVSSTELNSLSHALLAGWTLVAGVLLIVLYRYEANAVTGTFALVESRKRNRGLWILKGFVFVPMAASVAWLAGYGALARANTCLSGAASRHEAVVTHPGKYIAATASCEEIEVRLEDGATHWICVRRRPWGEHVPANADCAAVGARAEVAETNTALGKTLTLLSIDAPGC